MSSNSDVCKPLVAETTPGAPCGCPFSPPADFAGGAGCFLSLMRFRYRSLEHRLCFDFFVQAYRDGRSIQFSGPYTAEAMSVLARLEGMTPKQKAG